jgi:phage tail tube protein FII
LPSFSSCQFAQPRFRTAAAPQADRECEDKRRKESNATVIALQGKKKEKEKGTWLEKASVKETAGISE